MQSIIHNNIQFTIKKCKFLYKKPNILKFNYKITIYSVNIW
jgi:hypothetical protein